MLPCGVLSAFPAVWVFLFAVLRKALFCPPNTSSHVSTVRRVDFVTSRLALKTTAAMASDRCAGVSAAAHRAGGCRTFAGHHCGLYSIPRDPGDSAYDQYPGRS